ncbi:molybdenum cofactor guanylyltransferase [Oceanobacillus senegalensis]|uniref:molybdenum cofactor guanylyltransferase n=1 Tax=Oceanobacillus senegalensis TaxID=1936063 RepID=UPI0015C41845|nr:molybdenum cofactor guanylyltransferase [Oceanobacillus senegalensis]
MKDEFVGVVLAGGKSRRFGSPKSFAIRNGKAFYEYSIDALCPEVESLLVVTNPQISRRFFHEHRNFAIINDIKEFRGQGPLAGIYTAMQTLKSEWYIVIPTDVPFMESRIIAIIKGHVDENFDAVIPESGGKVQPLIGIYRHTVKDVIQKQLKQGNRAVSGILNECRVKYISIEEEYPFYNINRQEDYAKWISSE